jgi:hypothetical protein
MAMFFFIALSISYSMTSEDEDALRGRKVTWGNAVTAGC